MSCMGKNPPSGWPVAPDGSDIDVCHTLVVCYCGEQAGQAKSLEQIKWLELKAKEWVQAAPGAAKCSLGMASQVAQLRWCSSLLLSLTGKTCCLTYHQYTIANTTHKLHWHACTQGRKPAPAVLLHAYTCLCGCAMGTSTGPKQAVAHAFMPIMSVGNPSR